MLKTWLEDEYTGLVCGIDEAGRGPLAGPCVVSGVVLPLGYSADGIDDSKKLSAKKRDELYQRILRDALWHMTIVVSPKMIDHFNIYQAAKYGMRLIAACAPTSVILTDAMPFSLSGRTIKDYIKGDQKSINIAAASILAKVQRDSLMDQYELLYPGYGFGQHKGYPTKTHLEALSVKGLTPIHRLSFKPVSELRQLSLFD